MRKKLVLSVLFLLGILFMAFTSASVAEEAITLKSKRFFCKLQANYNQKDNSTVVTIQAQRNKQDFSRKSSVRFPGFVQIKGIKNFCGPDSGALVVIYRGGSRGFMRYEVYSIDARTAKLTKIPGLSREIPDGVIVPDDGGFFVFSGVRYSTAYYKEGFVVEEKPLATVVKKDVPTVIFSLRGDGEIETFPSDLSAKGIQIRKGQKLYFLRNDFYEPLEDIRCEDLAMELPLDEPCVRTFPDAGKGIITVEVERNIIKIPLTVE